MIRSTCLALLLFTGCARVNRNLSTTMPYRDMIGRVYITQEDFTIYKYSDSKTILISKPGDSNRFFEAKILGTLPKGSKLELIEVREEGNFEMTFPTYYTRVTQSSDPQWLWKIVSPADIEELEGK